MAYSQPAEARRQHGASGEQKSGGLGHAASATVGTEAALLTRKRHKPLEVTPIATYAKEPMFAATAF